MDATEKTAVPRPAATLAILRDSDDRLEVLLTQRPAGMRFMGGAIVFPGGAGAAADRDPAWARASRLDGAAAAALLGDAGSDDALGYFVCALREAFEEVGLPPAADASIARAEARSPERFLEACLGAGARLDTDALVPAGRWVTPLGSPIRFDARFFLVGAPRGWEPAPDRDEVAACYWSTPQGALDALARADVVMAPPTIEMLQRLRGHASAAEALSAMRNESAQQTGELLAARLSPLVQVVLAPNPGLMTGPGTNTYIVGSGPTAVIDPAVDDDGFISAVMAAAGSLGVILVTHRHADHVGGAARLASLSAAPVRAFGDQPAGGAPVRPLADADVVEIAGGTLRALHTPGHARDHLCFHLEAMASLFAGDNVLGEGTPVIAPPEGNLRAYLASLERLLALDLERIYPGHFRPLDGGTEVLRSYLEHRAERERAILDCLDREWRTLDDIVAAAYRDTPEYLHPIAAYSARAHLDLLEEIDAVQREGERWRRNQ